jgi:serine/threonine protein kinase
MGAADGAPQMVVIKALNPSLQGEPDTELERTLIGNFRNEAMALDRVRHPNIINRLGHGTALDLQNRTFHYLVLEYLPGGDLQALCRSHSLSLQQTIFYFEQVADGLEHAHKQHVIHRDIKPSNLLLTADHRTVKIADFGVAKIEAVEGAITRVGTDVYAAPEHHPLMQTGPLDINALAARKAPHLTPAADVYSLAKTVYMLLTGEAPRRFSQRPITELPPSIADEPWASFVLRVLRRATATISAERYQTVGEFRAELRDATMPRTQLLSGTNGAAISSPTTATPERQKASFNNLSPQSPPPVSFDSPLRPSQRNADYVARPRIVVPVAAETPVQQSLHPREDSHPSAGARIPPHVAAAIENTDYQSGRLSSRKRRWLVALLLIAAFAVMLLATHNYVRGVRFGGTQTTTPTRTRTPVSPPDAMQVGAELLASTDVNVRQGPTELSSIIGRVGRGSRVRVLTVNGGWLEVEVLERATPIEDVEFSSNRGWISRKFLRTK